MIDPTRTAAPDSATASVADPATDTAPPLGPPAPSAATTASDRYVLGEEIARGGMGEVYRATDTVLNREVAVKVLQARYGPASAAARRFADEARITGQLQHPAIPPVHDLGTLPDGRPFLAMKLIKGETLDQLQKARPDPTADRGKFVAVFEAICQAVAYAHAHGVIHRDLKPANVMVGNFGEVQVMDWGLAKVLVSPQREQGTDADPESTAAETEIKSTRDSDDQFTQAGSVLGTPAFMPPEQAIGAVDQIDRRSDVFGLGGILAAILTGKPPFQGDTAESTRQLAAKGKVADCFARLDGSGADPELVALCKRCLAAEKDDRPADAGAVAKAVAVLRQAADERARLAELDKVKAEGDRAAAQMQAAEQRKRRRVQLALFALAGVLLVGIGAFAWWQNGQAQEVRQRHARNAEAMAGLLDQCEEALRAGDADKAEVALEAARKRSTEGGAQDQSQRLERLGADLTLLRDLDKIDRFRWTVDEGKLPDPKDVAGRYREALGRFGADPDAVPPDEAAARAADSAVKDRLVAAFDRVLREEKTAGVRVVLQEIDEDPFRDAVRDAERAADPAKVAELAGLPVALEQPPGFAAFLGESRALRVERQRQLLEVAVRCLDPKLAVAHDNLGSLLYAKKDLVGAEAAFREAIRLDPKLAVAHDNLGSLLYAKKDLVGAEAAFREAIRLDPKGVNARKRNQLGNVLWAKGDLAGAEAAYKEAIRLDPKFPLTHSNLGIVLLAKGDLAGGEAAYREAIRLDPKSAIAHYKLGDVLWIKGDPDGTVAAYKEAIRLDPKFVSAHNSLGRLLAKKDPAGAEAAYREVIRHSPKSTYTLSSLVVRSRYEHLGVVTEYIEHTFSYSMFLAHIDLGNVLSLKGDLTGAEAAYREAIRLDPQNVSAHISLGTVLWAKKDLPGAEAAYREAIRLDPKYAYAQDGLGAVLSRKKDLTGAEMAYKDAIRLDPKFVSAHAGLGWTLQQKGDLEGAVASYKDVLRIDPKNAYALANLPRAERMRELLPKLPDILAGKGEPKTPAEACEFASLCAQPFQKRYTAAVRLYEKAFAADPKLADDFVASHRYNAACCAVRAAGGEGIDAPADAADRLALRNKALAWLRADLTHWKKQAASANADQRKTAAARLTQRLADSDLSGVRDAKALDQLPAAEREQWRQLWAEVNAALAEAQKPVPPPELAPSPRLVK